MKFESNRRAGQTIVEAMVGVTVIVIGLLGVLSLVGRSLAINNDVRAQFVATYLAAEGIEVVRNIIDANYARGDVWDSNINSGTYSISWDSTSLETATNQLLRFDGNQYGYAAGDATPYQRTIRVVNNGSDISVESEVTWVARGDNESVLLEDHFFNWR